MRVAAAALLILSSSTCASVATRAPRPAPSTYDCMRAVVRDKVPADLPDKRAHCLAAGLIARYCSVTEAYLSGAGKEFRDLLSAGDAEWNDWRADRAGVDCARLAADDGGIASCCSTRGY